MSYIYVEHNFVELHMFTYYSLTRIQPEMENAKR